MSRFSQAIPCGPLQVALESAQAESGRQLADARREAVQRATEARAEVKAREELVKQLQQRAHQLADELELAEQGTAVGSTAQTSAIPDCSASHDIGVWVSWKYLKTVCWVAAET